MTETATSEPAASPALPASAHQPARPGPNRRTLSLIGGSLAALATIYILIHLAHREPGSKANRLPVVAVERVRREDLAQSLTLSAEFRPYQQVALHAKLAGYLQTISVDVGDHVREGQIIAQLDVPELKDELAKMEAALGGSKQEVTRAEAAYNDVHLSSQRLEQVAKEHPKLVAEQDVDTARSKDAGAASAVGAARQNVEQATAEVSRVKSLLGYTNIVAPFEGVITKRLADPGALIQAGTASNTQAMPVVELAEDKRLRLVFPVPESAVSIVRAGSPVHITVEAVGQTFDGKVARFSDKVDHATRTMWTEVDVENPEGRFKPGMIATAALETFARKDAVAVPVQAVSGGSRPMVLVVNAANEIEQRPVKLGLQTPSKDEVLQGLQAGELVVVGSHSGIQPGQKVEAKQVTEFSTE